MGCFDTVHTTCPLCGTAVEFQSKAGVCNLEQYNTLEVPIEVAIDLAGETKECPKCHATVKLVSTLPKIVGMSTCAEAKSTREMIDIVDRAIQQGVHKRGSYRDYRLSDK